MSEAKGSLQLLPWLFYESYDFTIPQEQIKILGSKVNSLSKILFSSMQFYSKNSKFKF